MGGSLQNPGEYQPWDGSQCRLCGDEPSGSHGRFYRPCPERNGGTGARKTGRTDRPGDKRAFGRGAFWHLAHGRSEGNRRGDFLPDGDTVAGIIVDADGKLVAEDLEHGFDDGAMEAITEYLYEKVPEPFIKQFYVVNDAYGDKAEREYQYFENLDEAIQAYHLLPNHLDKRLGMESREPVTSRMTLLKCENGIENVEDVKKASLDGKWINDEVADAYNHAQFYLDNKDTNIVYELPSMKGYFYIQTSAEGWFDYTFYDRKYRELDGGSYENTDISIQEAVEALLNEEKIMLAQCHVVCWNDFMEAVTEAGQREIQGKIEMPLTSGITEKEKALGDMSRSAIEETVLCYAQAQLEDMGLEDEVKLNAARVYGSRTRAGLYNNGSDLDVVLFYTGNIREDDFFSALHKAGMAIVGIPLDITPVSENRTYTMESASPETRSA